MGPFQLIYIYNPVTKEYVKGYSIVAAIQLNIKKSYKISKSFGLQVIYVDR